MANATLSPPRAGRRSNQDRVSGRPAPEAEAEVAEETTTPEAEPELTDEEKAAKKIQEATANLENMMVELKEKEKAVAEADSNQMHAIVEYGKVLNRAAVEVKAKGEKWEKWVAANCGHTPEYANVYRRVALRWDDIVAAPENIQNLGQARKWIAAHPPVKRDAEGNVIPPKVRSQAVKIVKVAKRAIKTMLTQFTANPSEEALMGLLRRWEMMTHNREVAIELV